MLGESKAFSGFAVDDIEAARGFYGDVLGLTVTEYGPPIAWFRDPAGDILSIIQLS
jgi:catechol 2,3-dioxygenase-like lactoylglutathione lyase family enzyme